MTRKVSWGLVAVALVLLWVLHSERQVGEDAGIVARAHAALAQGQSFRQHLAKLRSAAQAQADSARRWKAAAVAQGAALIRLDAQLAQMRTPAESLPVVLAQRDTALQLASFWQATASRWELAYRADSMRAVSLESRLTLLEANLAATLTVADCRLLGLHFLPRCPSRNTAAVVGVGVGIVGTLLVKH